MSPRGVGSHGGSPSCLSPGPGSGALSPGRLTPGKGFHGGKHFTSIAWPDIRELLTNYDGANSPERCFNQEQDPEEGTCRSQLICAYVARPSQAPEMKTTPKPSPSPASPPCLPTDHEDPSAQSAKSSQKTSYATTVNLQIAGSGRITSFSKAQVSLTQTLAPVGVTVGLGDGQGRRRVSINGSNLSPLP